MEAYLLVHFIGTESRQEQEQVYFSVSEDGKTWSLLNKGRPVLKNTLGEEGARDPFIIRREDGNGFYVIATDLSIYRRKCSEEEKRAWQHCTNGDPQNPYPGSRGAVIWESADLIHWSKPSWKTLAPEKAGCYWAPKCIWDAERNAYMVEGASKMPEDGYTWLRLYRSYTKDFKSFTLSELYADMTSRTEEKHHIFDCCIVKEGRYYYRIFKTDRIQMERAESLSGSWEKIDNNLSYIAPHHEGPALCRLGGQSDWLLMLDNLETKGGYQFFTAKELSKGQFTGPLPDISFPDVKYRHGSLLAITKEEYAKLIEGFGEHE